MTEELRAALRLEHEKQREHRVVTPRSARV